MKHLFFIFLFISSCCFLNAQSLKGTSWLLVSIDNLEAGKSTLTGEKTPVSLQFDSDTTFSGTGCNHYKGVYKTENAKTLAMNKADFTGTENCLGLGNLEKETIAFYVKAVRYRMDDGRLFIFTSDDYRLCFKKQ